jgi:hypothetical protein
MQSGAAFETVVINDHSWIDYIKRLALNLIHLAHELIVVAWGLEDELLFQKYLSPMPVDQEDVLSQVPRRRTVFRNVVLLEITSSYLRFRTAHFINIIY